MTRLLRHCEGHGPEAIQGVARSALDRVAALAMTSLASLALLSSNAAAQDRAVVEATAPTDLAVTVYRDPNRRLGQEMRRDWPSGFAMISETRQVTLPPGESTIRFTGVAEGMVAVSAIVTGLPGGTIEKNRNADLLSPAALVDGTLGNRVRVTRTNPGTGAEETSSAIIRTRADGGLVLQTNEGFEAVRCSGIPERLTFDSVPAGLSAQPVFSIDTRDASGGTYEITLTYLAWGFDWQANYVATLHEGGSSDDLRFSLMSWLTILNDNGQSFEDADLMAVAGTLNVESDFEGLSDPPQARPLRLTCYPLGSTAAGSPYRRGGAPMPPPMAQMAMAPMMRRESYADEVSDMVVVTGSRIMASEEALGDLKLYRIPLPVDVNGQGLKQVAFLDQGEVEGRFLYSSVCTPWRRFDGDGSPDTFDATSLFLVTRNDDEHGLGMALPMGRAILFERGSRGELPVGELELRDYAEGQDVELLVGASDQVMSECARVGAAGPEDNDRKWTAMRVSLSNANPHPVTVRLDLGESGQWNVRFPGQRTFVKDGLIRTEVTVPANSSRSFDWSLRYALARD
ncbi:DUF4139 domain-containing protein [Alteraurantiacibacter aquimixticola]|uniref:DUF4139 domain-containing protein n=1 Tax=Alteraurantiacibacter aquimixticola TaxID=2489173 RepID=A0A4T3EZZ7_9SPHN|nr:hypothetical protein [Alteraurantiacibacter aquimixticola]TIX50349.1 hypothetical protein E5222_08705 [Alteraurantiacibacter aquimixticola]